MTVRIRPDARAVPDRVVRSWLSGLGVEAELPVGRFSEPATRVLRAIRDRVSLVIVDPSGGAVSAGRLGIAAIGRPSSSAEVSQTGPSASVADDVALLDLRRLSRTEAIERARCCAHGVLIAVLDANAQLESLAHTLLGERSGTWHDGIVWSELRTRVWLPGRDDPWPDRAAAIVAIGDELHRIMYSSGTVAWFGTASWAPHAVQHARSRMARRDGPPPDVAACLPARLTDADELGEVGVGECVVLGLPASLESVASLAHRTMNPARATFVASDACEFALALCARRMLQEGLLWGSDDVAEGWERVVARAQVLWADVGRALQRRSDRRMVVLDLVAGWQINRSNAASIVCWVEASSGADLWAPVYAVDGDAAWVWWPVGASRSRPPLPPTSRATPLGFSGPRADLEALDGFAAILRTAPGDARIRSVRRALAAA